MSDQQSVRVSLEQPILQGEENYKEWSKSTYFMAKVQGIHLVMTGEEKRPTPVPPVNPATRFFETNAPIIVDQSNACMKAVETWARKDGKACSIIYLSTTETVRDTIQNCETAAEMWEKLKRHYEKSGLSLAYEMLTKLANLKVENCESIEDYCSQFESLHNSCKQLDCGQTEKGVIILFLHGLAHQFDTWTSRKLSEAASAKEGVIPTLRDLIDEAIKQFSKASHRLAYQQEQQASKPKTPESNSSDPKQTDNNEKDDDVTTDLFGTITDATDFIPSQAMNDAIRAAEEYKSCEKRPSFLPTYTINATTRMIEVLDGEIFCRARDADNNYICANGVGVGGEVAGDRKWKDPRTVRRHAALHYKAEGMFIRPTVPGYSGSLTKLKTDLALGKLMHVHKIVARLDKVKNKGEIETLLKTAVINPKPSPKPSLEISKRSREDDSSDEAKAPSSVSNSLCEDDSSEEEETPVRQQRYRKLVKVAGRPATRANSDY